MEEVRINACHFPKKGQPVLCDTLQKFRMRTQHSDPKFILYSYHEILNCDISVVGHSAHTFVCSLLPHASIVPYSVKITEKIGCLFDSSQHVQDIPIQCILLLMILRIIAVLSSPDIPQMGMGDQIRIHTLCSMYSQLYFVTCLCSRYYYV